MKSFTKILTCLLCVIGFATCVNAATYSYSSLTVYNSGEKYEYVTGLPINYLTASGYNLYILNTGTIHANGTVLTNPVQANNGFAYIVNNSNVTSSSYKNYYIASVAILWYQDYLNSNDANISSTLKNYISSTTNDTVCYYIYKLFNNAKNYGTNGNSIKFLDKEITFTRNGNYYYSNVIDVETYNLNTTPAIKLYNAPTSSEIINSTVTTNGTGSFQIRIPLTSLSNVNEKDFEVYITAGSVNNTIYKYSNSGFGETIYGRTYSVNGNQLEASMPVNIKGISTKNVRLNILDKNGHNISNLVYDLYSGDCTNSGCYNDDLIYSFTTGSSYVNLNNVLTNGTYTLVNKNSNYNGNYNLPYRIAFTLNGNSSIEYVTIEEDNYTYNNTNNNNYGYSNYNSNYVYNNNNIVDNYIYNNSKYYNNKRDVQIYNKINDSADIINIYTISNVLVKSYRSSEISYIASLEAGNYYLVDSKNKFNTVYFRVTDNGDLLVKYNNEYVLSSYIMLDKNNYYVGNFNNGTINKKFDDERKTYYVEDLNDDDVTSIIETTAEVKVEWLSNIVDCPITSLDSTVKYIIGSMISVTGLYLVVRNAKKKETNI